jgi:hypothetical protein
MSKRSAPLDDSAINSVAARLTVYAALASAAAATAAIALRRHRRQSGDEEAEPRPPVVDRPTNLVGKIETSGHGASVKSAGPS